MTLRRGSPPLRLATWTLTGILAGGPSAPLAAQRPNETGGAAPPAAPHKPVSPPPPGDPPPITGCSALSAGEAGTLALAAASAIDLPQYAIAVVDRPGNVLALYVQGSPSTAERDRAVGLARTGAFFSNDQAPLSSRTVRFVSGLHFPPGVARTPNAALYGIENTNRGCDLHVTWLPGQSLPRATSVAGGACDAFSDAGCGTGPVTGKVVDLSGSPVDTNPLAVDPGGVPIFRGASLAGGIGVAVPPSAPSGTGEFGAIAAIAALGGGLTPFPAPLPAPGVVFIDGVRLPFLQRTTRPPGVSSTAAPGGSFAIAPSAGACAPDGYLVGPNAGTQLSAAEVDRIVQQAVAAAARTRAVIRLPIGSRTRMAIAVGDVDGTILALYRMPDATVFSVDVAVAKARNVAYFSGPGGADLAGVPAGTAISNRTLGFAAQPLFPAGIDGSGPGPFFALFVHDTLVKCSQGFASPAANQNGIVFFPGSLPLYRGGALAGGLGVSGDGVEQDDYVTYLGAQGFLPPRDRWADTVFVDGVRLPFLKFPRNPEK